MIWSVHNPTHRTKAVSSAGGLEAILPGETRQFDEDWDQWTLEKYAAADLQLSRGAAEPAPEPAPAEDSSTTSSSSRADVLVGVAAAFPEGDDDYWMRDGRPQISAINAALPEGAEHFTAAERDALWRELK